MIHVERGIVPLPPQQLHRIEAARARTEAEAGKLGRQQRVLFNDAAIREYREALFFTFANKCAFCETRVGVSAHGHVLHLRPKSLYPHLAYDWHNLYLACQLCSANKGGGDTFDPKTGGLAILDPCVDWPDASLRVTGDGLLVAREGLSDSEFRRAVQTISLFGLNREPLVEARKQVFERVTAALRAGQETLVEEACAGYAEYAGAARAAAHVTSDAPKPSRPATASRTGRRYPTRRPNRATFISAIEIEGFRLASGIQIDVGPKWFVLLGENGTAKTTILQGLALALMGESHAKHWPSNRVRRGENDGRIRVHLTTDPEPIEVQFTKDKVDFISGSAGARTVLRAYGATRLTSERKHRRRPVQWIDNLFSPWATLLHPDQWAKELNQAELDAFGLVIKDVLGLHRTALVEVRNDSFVVETSDGVFPFEELSSGYQSMVSLIADLTLAARMSGVADPLDGQAIVLIDELGNHLHPRWRMEVVPRLRRAFPNMQFIVTTHEPLCLRGVRAGESALLERDEGGVRIDSKLPDPSALRVDQLLTSRFFGLFSTVDPEVDAKFRKYYSLLAERDNNSADRQEAEALRLELSNYGVLGYTRRDQMVYEAIDEFLAKEPSLEGDSRESLRQDTKKRVAEIWDNAARFADRKL